MGEVRVEGVERLPPEPEPEAEEREPAARVLRRAAGAALAPELAAVFAGVEATVLAVTVTGEDEAAGAAGVLALAAAAGIAVTGVVPAAGLAAAALAAAGFAPALALAEVLVARDRGVAMTVMG